MLGTAVPYTAKLSEILAICGTWKSPGELSGRYIGGDTMIDAYVKTLVCGAVKEDRSPGSGSHLTQEECRLAYSSMLQSGQVDGTNQSCED